MKRVFDVIVSGAGLLLLSPLLLVAAVAVVCDSGFPVFFAHRRVCMLRNFQSRNSRKCLPTRR